MFTINNLTFLVSHIQIQGSIFKVADTKSHEQTAIL